MSKSADLAFGSKHEKKIHNKLESVFGELKNSRCNPEMGKYYEFDKYNDNYFIEIKTRRIRHNTHCSLFFGKNKLVKGDKLLNENPNLRIFYLWQCSDGVYGWEHRSTEFNIEDRGRTDRGKDEINKCVDIETRHLKPLTELLT